MSDRDGATSAAQPPTPAPLSKADQLAADKKKKKEAEELVHVLSRSTIIPSFYLRIDCCVAGNGVCE